MCMLPPKAPFSKAGFTLVELAIVLVIIGLIIGGVLVGRDLIKAAELRKATVEYTQWQTGVYAFRGKYNALAGDMRNATTFFGVAADCNVSTLNLAGGTCNGDGNRKIFAGGVITNNAYESVTFWQHLSKAQVIPGTYAEVDVATDLTDYYPVSRSGLGYWMVSREETLGSMWPDSLNRNLFMLVGQTEPGGLGTTPEEAWKIDNKIDDGLPARGRITTIPEDVIGTGCTVKADGTTPTAVNSFDAKYKLQNVSKACMVLFVL